MEESVLEGGLRIHRILTRSHHGLPPAGRWTDRNPQSNHRSRDTRLHQPKSEQLVITTTLSRFRVQQHPTYRHQIRAILSLIRIPPPYASRISYLGVLHRAT